MYLLPKRIATICHNLPHFQQSATNLPHAYPFVLQRDKAPLWQIGRFSREKPLCTRTRVTLFILYKPPFTPWLLRVLKSLQRGIKKLDFKVKRGAMAAYLTDGREIIVPVSMFPDIKHLSRKQREEWMNMDDQYFSFEALSRIYSVKDLMRI